MARKRSGGILLPWLSANADCREGRFLQVGNSLLLSDEFQALTSGAQMLYLFMALEAGGKREVEFSRSTAKKYGLNKNSFARQIKELVDNHFIEISSYSSFEQFKPTTYQFVLTWKCKGHAPEMWSEGQRN